MDGVALVTGLDDGHRTLTAQIPVIFHSTTGSTATKTSGRKAIRKKRRAHR